MQLSQKEIYFTTIAFGFMTMISNVGGFASVIFYAFFYLYSSYNKSHFEIESVRRSFKIRTSKFPYPE